ncbi:MAG: ribonuclease HII [Candidatus Pacebacteria bacterium]|jgi:ribonuclease HII|nr:ribonuclease HII [Candidatus Paceibacterota bacterium]MDD2796447.1 ribonuclease HII [Candidatus Paceibacterota bacterium]MDD3047833.1 ribonuclease HII [Candidatus Paceibacterota bacterium]MDD3509681.1 ribonuclease HII [Candidatus Paceibacterota bacterium]MDD3918693.1 ribonuclease HII [Candidatus Paceibacterota bacterium]
MNLNEETRIKKQGFKYVIGLDEAGRGALAGPVVASAIYYKGKNPIQGVKDSKKISPSKRKNLALKLTNHPCVLWGIGIVPSKTIDKINILEASKIAMQKALFDLEKKYKIKADYLILDGKMKLDIPINQISIIKGDDLIFSCSAASIIAKVTRDFLMEKASFKYPEYSFERHKGYGTKLHLSMLKKHGACSIHRKSFKPIKKIDNKV